MVRALNWVCDVMLRGVATGVDGLLVRKLAPKAASDPFVEDGEVRVGLLHAL